MLRAAMCRITISVARKSTARCGYGSSMPTIRPPGETAYHATVFPLALTQDHSRSSWLLVRQLQLYSCPSEAMNFRWRGPPTSTRNAAIACVRNEPPGPISEMSPSAPAAPYSMTAIGIVSRLESMLYTSYRAAPSGSRRLQNKRIFMRSYRSTKSDPNSEPDLSKSMNGIPVFMLSRITTTVVV